MYLNPKERAKSIYLQIENELDYKLPNRNLIVKILAKKQVQNIYNALQETGQPIKTMVYWKMVEGCIDEVYNSKIWLNNIKSNKA